eukprot:16445757-Heterocapsa_arctica.AAC.1
MSISIAMPQRTHTVCKHIAFATQCALPCPKATEPPSRRSRTGPRELRWRDPWLSARAWRIGSRRENEKQKHLGAARKQI